MKPKYTAVYEALLQRIQRMNPGDKLESEAKLAENFKVAPMTVRRALEMLANEGRTIGQRGRGTFVVDPLTLQGSGIDVLKGANARLISATIESAGNPFEQMGLSGEEFVYRMVHTRFVGDKVVAVQNSMLVASAFTGLLGRDLTRSLSDILAEDGLSITETDIGMGLPDMRETQLLELDEPQACLSITQRWGKDPVRAISVTLVRTDRWTIRL
ncbi:GntR family transcriptional regulator [Schaalia sp. lx-100]|uniref:GntR family transcriptional regulator n=1 Tax=Schaalia sp. lx-100 TaxID=2899081 RepID=UPI0022AC7CBB|nr:GntR family transcriptional regulator [Schaalia sp. lx-100]